MKNLVWLLLILCAVGCAGEPVKPKLMRSMAQIDRAYIPVSVFTGLKKQRESELAFDLFRRQWEDLYGKYYGLEFKYGVDIVDKFWKEDLDRVKNIVLSSEAEIKGKKLAEAHKRLAGIPIILLGLRHRNGLNYFLDELADFDLVQKEINKLIAGKNKLTELEKNRLEKLAQEAGESWGRVASAEIDGKLFRLNGKNIKAMRKRISVEAEAVKQLIGAAAARDEEGAIAAAPQLLPEYIIIYRAFGDFKPIFDQVKKEKIL